MPAPELRVKLEGAGKVGERYVGMVGVRDPYTIAHIDEVIAWARQTGGASASAPDGVRSCTTRSMAATAIMGALEPNRDRPAHELCVVVQGVAPTRRRWRRR